jgi:hypothetical protein
MRWRETRERETRTRERNKVPQLRRRLISAKDRFLQQMFWIIRRVVEEDKLVEEKEAKEDEKE